MLGVTIGFLTHIARSFFIHIFFSVKCFCVQRKTFSEVEDKIKYCHRSVHFWYFHLIIPSCFSQFFLLISCSPWNLSVLLITLAVHQSFQQWKNAFSQGARFISSQEFLINVSDILQLAVDVLKAFHHLSSAI